MSDLLAARAIRSAGLTIFVLTVYLGVVVVGGWLAGIDRAPIGLMLAATTLVAVTIEPASRWLTKQANRFVYGHRFAPWEAVRRLSTAMGVGQEPEEVLVSMAEAIRDATRAEGVVVWLSIQGKLAPMAAAPADSLGDHAPMAGDRLRELDNVGLVVPIRQGTDELGAITVAGNALLPHQLKWVEDLAASATIATRTTHLRESIRLRLDHTRSRHDELIAARAGTARAQLAERRRLERNLHDTCQQRAVALAGKIGLVQGAFATDAATVGPLLTEIDADIRRLSTNLAGVAGGRVLPQLVDLGVGAALEVETADLAIEVRIVDGLVRRHHSDVEEAIFSCCMEALQNVVKHAAAGRIEVTLSEDAGLFRFSVRDDGIGFDPSAPSSGAGLANLRERMTAVKGALSVTSGDYGTEIAGEVPV